MMLRSTLTATDAMYKKKQAVPSMQGTLARIARAKDIGFNATSPEGLSPLERGFYFRKLELEASCPS